MAKMMPRWERKLRKVIRSIGEAGKVTLRAHEVVKTPHKVIANSIFDKLSKVNKVPKRRGQIRNRQQFYNPKINRWIVQDTKTGKILRQKKGKKPYKNIRIAKRKRR